MPQTLLRLVLLAAILCAPAAAAWAASAADARRHESGAPLIRNFGAGDYGGAVQNWGVVQDARGLIYVANTEDGVLEYDGVRWRKIQTPDRSAIRSLAVDAGGRIYVGGVGEIGYLAPDAAGLLQFVSLRERLAPRDRDFADVWRTFATPQGVYFSTFKRLIRIQGDQVRTWVAPGQFHIAQQAGEQVFVREVGRGLLRLVDDELQPVAQGERFASEKIYAMLPWAEGSVLIGTRTQGWFIHDGQRLRPWQTQADAELLRDHLYDAVWLADGRLAAATLRGGVYLLDRDGARLGRIDKGSGLADQTVYHLFQDRQGALWLSLDNGLARVDVATPLTVFGQRSGLHGSTMALYRHAGTLYAGTTQGLFRLDTRAHEAARFVAVPGVGDQTWEFLDDGGGGLLIAHLRGVFALRDGQARLVLPTQQGALALARSRADPARVFVGLQNGIVAMRRENGRWRAEGPVADMTDEVRSIQEMADGSLWLGTLSSGVMHLLPRAGSGGRPSYRIERYGKAQGVPPGTTHVGIVGGALTVASTRGILGFDPAGARFVPDPRFAHLFAQPRWISSLAEDAQGRVWMFTNDQAREIKESGVAVRDASGVYRWDGRAMRHVPSDSLLGILADDGIVWFGGDDGVYRYDARQAAGLGQPFAAQVRRVSRRNGDTLYGGAGRAAAPALAFEDNSLRFELAAPGYGLRPMRFQVRLEGADADWSPWSADSHRDYTNLREGSYRLRVRAQNPFGATSEEGVYAFTVLPPWYRSWPAYAAYLLLAVLSLTGLARWRSAALQSRNHQLEALVATRTAELSNANQALQSANAALAELSVTDTLTGLRNRRFLVDTIGHEIAAALRVNRHEQQHPPAERSHDLLFVMVDIDHFKQVNDRHGHAAGDRVLEQFAAILRQACRETDTPVRWGGEEFLIVARAAEPDAGAALAERIRANAAAHAFDLGDGRHMHRTCSVGFARFPVWPDAADRFGWETAVELADQCLYEAKRSGRNAWVGVRGTAQVPAAGDRVGDLQAAVQAGWLELVRSPVSPPQSAAGR